MIMTMKMAACCDKNQQMFFYFIYTRHLLHLPSSLHMLQDTALPISCGQTMPAFSVHAQMLSLLEPFVQPGAAVLDLGAGTYSHLRLSMALLLNPLAVLSCACTLLAVLHNQGCDVHQLACCIVTGKFYRII